MSVKTSKTKEVMCVISICLIGFAIMHDLAITVIINDLYKTFPNNMFGVNLIVSFAMAIAMVGSLIAPFFLKKMSKKTLIVIAMLTFAVSSVMGAWKVDIVYMNIINVISALSQGILTVCAAGLITDMYIDDEAKRGRIMGFYNAMMSVFGAVMSAVAGVLATGGWQKVYHIYYFAFFVALFCLIFIPNDIKPAAEAVLPDENTGTPKGGKFGAKFWLTCVIALFGYMAYMGAIAMESVYVDVNHIGDVAFTGMMVTVSTAMAFVVQMLFGNVFKKIGRGVVLLFIGMNVIGAAVMALFPSVIACWIGTLLVGGGYGGLFCFVFVELPSLAPAGKTDVAISMCTVISCCAFFGGMNLASSLMGSIGFNSALLILAGFGVIAIIMELFVRKMGNPAAKAES